MVIKKYIIKLHVFTHFVFSFLQEKKQVKKIGNVVVYFMKIMDIKDITYEKYYNQIVLP